MCSCGIVCALKINVEAGAGSEHWAAIFVVAGIIDVLQIEGGEETAPEVRGVESLDNFFGAVSEIAITEEKSEAAEREIFLVGFDDAIGDEDGSHSVIAPLPAIAFRKSAKLNGAVHFGVFVGFVAAIAPAEAAENAKLRRDFLLEIQAEAVTVAPFAASADDIRYRRLAILEIAKRLFVVAHVRLIQIAEEADDAVAMENAIAARFEFEICGA